MVRRTVVSLGSLALAGLLSVACSKQKVEGSGPTQIGGVVNAIETKELQEARFAQQRASDPAVKSFADRVVADLVSTRDQMSRLFQQQNIQPAVSQASQDIANSANRNINDLQAKNTGKDFDKAYVDQEVKDARDTLDKIDHDLAPKAGNPELKTFIQTSWRPQVEARLRMAQQLQDQVAAQKSDFADPQVAAVLAAINDGEIEEAKIAMNKGHSPEVKKLASQMQADHTSLKTQLNGLTQKLNIQPVSSDDSEKLSSHAKDELKELTDKTGTDFDEEYLDHQIEEHKDAISKLDSKLIPNARNAELKAMLQNVVKPKLQEHLQMAQQTMNDVGSRNRSGTGNKGGTNAPSDTPSRPGTQPGGGRTPTHDTNPVR